MLLLTGNPGPLALATFKWSVVPIAPTTAWSEVLKVPAAVSVFPTPVAGAAAVVV